MPAVCVQRVYQPLHLLRVRFPHDIPRRHLTVDQALEQARILRRRGFRHLLLVAGDFPSRMTTRYYGQLIRRLVGLGIAPAVEIAAQSVEAYAELVHAGRARHAVPGDVRLAAVCRVSSAGPSPPFTGSGGARPRGGAGVAAWDWASCWTGGAAREMTAMLRHAAYLASVSRIARWHSVCTHPQAPQGFRARYVCSDNELVRLYAALRVRVSQGRAGPVDSRAVRTAQSPGQGLHHADERRQFDGPGATSDVSSRRASSSR